jgi:hypothetical protein
MRNKMLKYSTMGASLASSTKALTILPTTTPLGPSVVSTSSTLVEEQEATAKGEVAKINLTIANAASPTLFFNQTVADPTASSFETLKAVEQVKTQIFKPAILTSTSQTETKVKIETVMLTPELLQFISSLKNFLSPEMQQQLQQFSTDEFREFKDWSEKVTKLEVGMSEAQSKLALDKDSRDVQDYINANSKLKNY